ncbi:MAG TPA: hypothetical protein DCM86_12830 [Verrucomicrobiales bacterium]|nr:hypothetical protein [Verrucomicrobiales bacterium]
MRHDSIIQRVLPRLLATSPTVAALALAGLFIWEGAEAADAASKPKPPRPRVPAIRVAAGALDRHDSIVSLELPAGLHEAVSVKGPDGKRIPLQVDPEGHGWLIVESLPAGSNRVYIIDPRPKSPPRHPGCELEFEEGELQFSIQRQPVITYHHEPGNLPRPGIQPSFTRGAYLHPVLTPGGVAVTDDYATNHLHHHGIWSSWPHTRFEGRAPDFWNMGQGKGTVIPLSLDSFWEGNIQGGFVSRMRYYDLTTTPRRLALEETWRFRIYAVGGKTPRYRLFDLATHQVASSPSPLELLEYRYGGLGVRGREEWNGAAKAAFLTSEGETNRVRANTTRARWCTMGGEIDGRYAGMAILCHPDSFRAPQPMRIHPDEPFFCYAPPQAGDFTIGQNAPYDAQYRFVVFDGPPDPALLNRLWEDWTHPAEATLEAL